MITIPKLIINLNPLRCLYHVLTHLAYRGLESDFLKCNTIKMLVIK